MSLQNGNPDPRGNLLRVTRKYNGLSEIELDNGPAKTITIHTYTESLGDLLDTGTRELWEHLMAKGSSRFRKKGKSR